jgi:hypothetical protein
MVDETGRVNVDLGRALHFAKPSRGGRRHHPVVVQARSSRLTGTSRQRGMADLFLVIEKILPPIVLPRPGDCVVGRLAILACSHLSCPWLIVGNRTFGQRLFNTSDTLADHEMHCLGDPLASVWGRCVLPIATSDGVREYVTHVLKT